MAAKIFRINYKSDFILTMNSEAGWVIPFCIKFWTSIPSRAYYVGYDGETYTHCAYDPSEPTKLVVQFDDHHLPIGNLHFQIAYHFTVADFPTNTEDEVFNATAITTEIDGETYQVMLDFTGETAPGIDFNMPSVGVTSVNGKIGAVTLNAEDVGAQPTIEDLATIRSGASEGATAVQPDEMTAALATKQNVIEDLATIRSGAAAGATAVQPTALQEGLAGKQDTISDLATIRSGAAAGATAYQKPGTGIPSTDLASAVQTSLERADEAAVRPYNTQSPDGMGYLVLDKDATFASQVTTANTIYEIRYDFDLNDRTVTMPDGCVLNFNGGSLSNGAITGNNTGINAGLVKIFDTDVTVAGTWNITESYPEWFGAKGDGVTDDRLSIQKCINSFPKIKFSKSVYLVSSHTDTTNKVCIVIPTKRILEGNAVSQYTMTTIKVADNLECTSILGLNGSWICIKYIGIMGGNSGDRDNYCVLNGIKSYNETKFSASLTFDHVFIESCVNGFNVLTYLCDVLSCRVDKANGTAFRFGGSQEEGRGTSVNMQKCSSYDCYGTVYDLSHLSYSTILCCSADRGGFNPNNLTAENIYPVFKLDYSRSLTLISCACESAYKIVSFTFASKFSFIDCLFATNQLAGVYTYFIQYSNFIKFENTQLATLGANDSTVFVQFDNQNVGGSFYNIVFSSCYYKINHDDYIFDFNNINANYIHGIEINKLSYQNEVSDILPSYINNGSYEFKKVCVWNCNSHVEIANGLSLNNVPTLLKFNGNGKNLYFLSQTTIYKINNCEHIEFNNFTIRVGFSATAFSPLFFLISNSKVTFRNCTFRVGSSSNGTTWSADNIFDATDSDIKLVNCNIINPMNKAIVKDAALTKNSTYTIVKSDEVQTSIDCEWRNTSGAFADKPTNIPVGFKYFCTNKQTSEGATNGIEIIYKGSGVWVDALGRVVS